MNVKQILAILLIGVLFPLAGLLLSSCEIDSAESAYRQVAINVACLYQNGDSPIVQNNTGDPISWLDLRQDGDKLEGYDNNARIFKGTIGQVTEAEALATFTLQGVTTAGNEGTISGTIEVSGSTRTMRGSWMEATIFAPVYATCEGALEPTSTATITTTPTATITTTATPTATSTGPTI